MNTSIALGLGLMLASVSAFSISSREGLEHSAFNAEISGEVSARPSGDARFGLVHAADGRPVLFTISLGANGSDGSVLFTRRSGARLSPGTYVISDRADGTDDMRALVMTGSATRPTGVFQGQSGSLVITEAGDSIVRGSFRIDATGFIAAEPQVEGRPVSVSGSFTAESP